MSRFDDFFSCTHTRALYLSLSTSCSTYIHKARPSGETPNSKTHKAKHTLSHSTHNQKSSISPAIHSLSASLSLSVCLSLSLFSLALFCVPRVVSTAHPSPCHGQRIGIPALTRARLFAVGIPALARAHPFALGIPALTRARPFALGKALVELCPALTDDGRKQTCCTSHTYHSTLHFDSENPTGRIRIIHDNLLPTHTTPRYCRVASCVPWPYGHASAAWPSGFRTATRTAVEAQPGARTTVVLRHARRPRAKSARVAFLTRKRASLSRQATSSPGGCHYLSVAAVGKLVEPPLPKRAALPAAAGQRRPLE